MMIVTVREEEPRQDIGLNVDERGVDLVLPKFLTPFGLALFSADDSKTLHLLLLVFLLH